MASEQDNQAFGLPAGLNRSYFDRDINFEIAGMRVTALSVKSLVIYLGSVVVLMWVVTHPLDDASFMWKVAIVVWWVAATLYFGSMDKAKQLRGAELRPLFHYIQPENRHVSTKRMDSPMPYWSILGIDSITTSGVIRYTDGTIGRMYSVVGNASLMLFGQDRNAVLHADDDFWRAVDPGISWMVITSKEAQRVDRPLSHVAMMRRGLDRTTAKELEPLMRERERILRTYVGGSFMSIHQYLLVRADTEKLFASARAQVEHVAMQSTRLMRAVEELDGELTERVLHNIYAGGVR